jgi:uncharacterized protein with PQ loop repeat
MKLSRLRTFVLSLAIIGVSFSVPLIVSAGFAENVKQGVTDTASKAELAETALPVIIGNVISVVLSLVGIIMLCYFIYAGLLYMTSQGDKTKVENAQKIMISTMIGLVIVALAYAISDYVLDLITRNVLGTS